DSRNSDFSERKRAMCTCRWLISCSQ
ncbi:MAG: hypothetical protein EZS28_045593, partial [Streblomastix strix]